MAMAEAAHNMGPLAEQIGQIVAAFCAGGAAAAILVSKFLFMPRYEKALDDKRKEREARYKVEDELLKMRLDFADLLMSTSKKQAKKYSKYAYPPPPSEPRPPKVKKLSRLEKLKNLAKYNDNPHEAELASKLAKELSKKKAS